MNLQGCKLFRIYILGDRLSVSTIRISEIITIQRLTGTSYMKFGQHVRVLSVQDFSKGERGMHHGDRRPRGASRMDLKGECVHVFIFGQFTLFLDQFRYL